MASTIATASPSMLVFGGNRPFLGNLRRLPVLPISGRRQSVAIVVRLSQMWSTPEDRIALAGLGFAAIVALWASTNLIGAIDKLPFVPGVLEFIGILFSWGRAVEKREEIDCRCFRTVRKIMEDALQQKMEEGLLRYGNDIVFTVMQSTFTGDMRQCDRIMMKGRFHHRMVRDQE
ncbi:Uncharacterized protein QJS10_CPA07g00770 [Acorus calamus]|uniref:Cyanobacterial aminoacyl-tRNA synthetase CAAD domain-containing protein n=1 Tax=Acorus calamus TaxID=4465 RepID=A0AAV9EF41_ACOCL|nr:Uncharacterized protein QJS10_CPA07g00770 [Acorus calamus]